MWEWQLNWRMSVNIFVFMTFIRILSFLKGDTEAAFSCLCKMSESAVLNGTALYKGYKWWREWESWGSGWWHSAVSTLRIPLRKGFNEILALMDFWWFWTALNGLVYYLVFDDQLKPSLRKHPRSMQWTDWSWAVWQFWEVSSWSSQAWDKTVGCQGPGRGYT